MECQATLPMAGHKFDYVCSLPQGHPGAHRHAMFSKEDAPFEWHSLVEPPEQACCGLAE